LAEQSPAANAERPASREADRTPDRPRQRRRWRDRRRPRRPRQCAFCVAKVSDVDYKQVEVLRPYVSERGKIRPRRQTGLCAKHQRQVARAIKRARHLALLPFTTAGHGRFSS